MKNKSFLALLLLFPLITLVIWVAWGIFHFPKLKPGQIESASPTNGITTTNAPTEKAPGK
ncbi:hypothetical protein Cflav_PD1972 [Pedosphaera parvula Ellin514]|uniref:Uncharacterized protein n=1 Tax=Pedosphaera parvula (strain Ellin514) TaxID=320771 RepID=B9XN03_PEDPL|nr:hypothetical protein Cflav_PD1972 [Pedosphaera parvula Ellin514]